MKTSGLFTIHSFTIPAKYAQPVNIVFFGDVHRDSPNHADGKWRDDLEYWKTLPNAYFIGMGDYLDSTSTSERECLANASKQMHDTWKRDLAALQQAKIDLIADELGFMKKRIIGLLNGNHYFEFKSGINGDQKLAEALDCKYLGVCSLVRVYFQFSAKGHQESLDFFLHHGQGAARLVGGSLNRVMQMFEGVESDVAAMGHDHKRGAVPSTPRLYLQHNSKEGLKIRQRETWAVRSGSYVASYRNNEVNYNIDSCRTPASLGHVQMQVKFTVNENAVRKEIKFIT